MSSIKTENQSKSANIIIVGGGVIGLSIARELALRGVRDIVLLERGEPGKEASWAAGGILAPQVEADCADDFFKLARASRDIYPAFAEALRVETGIDVELDQTGTLYVGFSDEDEDEMKRRFAWQQREGLRVEFLNGDQARQLEPNLSPDVRCALRFPDDWQVNNRRLVEALVAANEKFGVRLMTNCEVTSLRVGGGMVTGVHSSAGLIEAPAIVLAAGAWASRIESLATSLPEIEPVRGQMLCFKPEPQFARHVIYSSRGYLVPRRDGRLLAGSTSEHAGFDKRVTSEGIDSIKRTAFEIAPALRDLPVIDSWAGFRPRASDDLPVLGASEEIEGLFYATGHYRNGILLAPVTAKMIADAIVTGITDSGMATFTHGRFALYFV